MMDDETAGSDDELSLRISRRARREFGLEELTFREDGRVRLSSFAEVRRLAAALERERSGVGDLEALAVLDRVYRLLLGEAGSDDGALLDRVLADLEERLGAEGVDEVLVEFVDRFPPEPVFAGDLDARRFVDRSQTDRRHLLVETICVQLAHRNAPDETLGALFVPGGPAEAPLWEETFEALSEVPAPDGACAEDQRPVVDLIRAPRRGGGESLDEQLQYVRRRWSGLLPEWLDRRVLTTLDVIREEEVGRGGGGAGDAPSVEPPSVGEADAPRRYSRDRDWMPSLVLVAKNARVWLHQLSHRYDRTIERLDEIPGEALRTLADRGITGLWLIGVWERSDASRRIKRETGNDRAVASAYAIGRYEIADDLGGREAKETLERRAAQFGLRLAADMVPNHMGIDAEWVVEHPDWFLSVDEPPFANYTFDGPDLCDDDRARIVLEDHYYEQSDAAVVFEHTDHRSGETRYIYHGNDGTSTPWNDTAQIDFLHSQAREAVIDKIVDIARRFPVIRFDAAMALAKEQIHRLWYPAPGEGGAIPSRAEHGMTGREFEEAMPREFWREVVERIQREAPDTLLLAEAFWKMEGYFVRSLGMHRVYNSAFMHMLRDEDNAEYRELIGETLEFDPEILARYVNFMNNPDEETALEQFGDGDKYFGVCVVMATLPGLPMFGHGQIEGLSEKYGMDFDRPLVDESADEELVERHRRQIAPLLYRRDQFAGVEHFRLYDLETPGGEVDDNVFAYSNGTGEERSLVVYHNCYGETRGRVEASVPFRPVGSESEELVCESVAEALGLPADEDTYVAFRDRLTGREYLRRASDIAERGMVLELEAYEARVLVDFDEVRDPSGEWGRLCERLDGAGVEDLERALRDIQLEPVHEAARAYLGAERLMLMERPGEFDGARLEELRRSAEQLAERAASHSSASFDKFPEATVEAVEAAGQLEELESGLRPTARRLVDRAGPLVPETTGAVGVFAGWLYLHGLGAGVDGLDRADAEQWFVRLGLGDVLMETLREAGLDEEAARGAKLVRLLVRYADGPGAVESASTPEAAARQFVGDWLKDESTRRFLGVNEFDDTVWFHDESLAEFVEGLMRAVAIRALVEAQTLAAAREGFAAYSHILLLVKNAAETADSRVARLTDALDDRES
jgi:glycosidase